MFELKAVVTIFFTIYLYYVFTKMLRESLFFNCKTFRFYVKYYFSLNLLLISSFVISKLDEKEREEARDIYVFLKEKL